jgi:ankyrin repeat protein
MSSRRTRLTLRIGLPLLLIFAGLAVYFCFPSLRLPADASQLRALPGLQEVDAHRYDQEWFDAARAGRIDILGALHDARYPIDAQTHAGYTALILAAYDEQPAALGYLLQAGADPCLADRNGNTALMGALYKGELAIARQLLHTRCRIDQANNAGETALSFAALFGRLDILPELIALGADPNHPDARGTTPLAMALKQGNPEAAAALRKLGATP